MPKSCRSSPKMRPARSTRSGVKGAGEGGITAVGGIAGAVDRRRRPARRGAIDRLPLAPAASAPPSRLGQRSVAERAKCDAMIMVAPNGARKMRADHLGAADDTGGYSAQAARSVGGLEPAANPTCMSATGEAVTASMRS